MHCLPKPDIKRGIAQQLSLFLYQITNTLPESKHTRSMLLKKDDQKAELYQIIFKNF
jgi:hypothetical protein